VEAVRSCRTNSFPTPTLPSLLIRTNLMESDTIHLHHDVWHVRLNLKRLSKISKRALNLSRWSSVFRNFKVDCLNTVCTDIYITNWHNSLPSLQLYITCLKQLSRKRFSRWTRNLVSLSVRIYKAIEQHSNSTFIMTLISLRIYTHKGEASEVKWKVKTLLTINSWPCSDVTTTSQQLL